MLCCRWPLTEPALAAIGQNADGVDFGRVVRIVDRHRVQGLVHNALRAARVTLPAEIEAGLAARAQRIALRGLAMAAESSRLAGLAAQAGIDVVILKGAALAQLAYGTVALKQACDIDLAVAPENLARARALLAASGYAAQTLVVAKDEPWMNPQRQILVELHTKLVDHSAWLSGVGVGRPIDNVAIGETYAVPTLDPDRLFAYLCVHGAVHGWSRLKWLADFSALVAQMPAAEVTRRYETAGTWGARRCAGQALVLSADLFGTRLEPRLEARLRRDGISRWLVANAYRSFVGANETEELDARVLSTVRIHLAQLVFTPGWRNRAALLAGKLRARQPDGELASDPIGAWPIEAGRWLRRRFRRAAAVPSFVADADGPAVTERD
uniref:nucleotidyltransferase domain-containing protein n=1 Tax=uncultured Sphingomonas sp. TaxID=158754 RepID=UPI0035CAA07E